MTKHREGIIVSDEDEYDSGRCEKCGKKWPCKAYRRYMKSPAYRIEALEEEVARLTSRTARAEETARTATDRAEQTSRILREGVLLALRDAADGKRIGRITMSSYRDMAEVTSMGQLYRGFIGGMIHTKIVYQSEEDTYINGELTEKRIGPHHV